MVVVLFAMMIGLSGTDAAASSNLHYWSADRDYELCHLDIPIGETRTWRIVARADAVQGIHGAEFRVVGWPAGYIHTVVTPNPDAAIVIGNPLDLGCNITWVGCEADPTLVLFTIETLNVSDASGASVSIEQHAFPSDQQCSVLYHSCSGQAFTSTCVPGSSLLVNQGSSTPPANPSPTHASTGVATSSQLAWSTGHPGSECAIGISEHRVYLGTNNDPPLIGIVSPLDNTVFDPGVLLPSATYYWRVEAIDTGFGITGPLWSFTTQDPVAVAGQKWARVKQLYR
jgi:hypothetical protein